MADARQRQDLAVSAADAARSGLRDTGLAGLIVRSFPNGRRAAMRLAIARLARDAAEDIEMGRAALWLPVGFALGIGVYFALPAEPAAWLTVVGAAALIAAAIPGRGRQRALPLLAAAAAASIATGIAAGSLETTLGGTPLLAGERTYELTGWIVGRETRGENYAVYVVRLASLEGVAPEAMPRRVRISARGRGAPLFVGDAITTFARLGPPRGPVFPGGYDSARRLFFDGIGGTGFSFGAPKLTELTEMPLSLHVSAAIETVRAVAAERIRESLPGTSGEVAAALLVGERGGIPAEVTEAIRVAGLGHVLAISGLHMALVAGTVFAAIRALLALFPMLALRFPIKRWAAVAGLVAAVGYLLLSGASVATQRAFIMLAIALFAVLLSRPSLTMRTVALAAMAVMLIKPSVVIAPGFQMSFLAVVALIGAYEWLSGRKRAPQALPPASRAGRLGRSLLVGFAGLALTSLIAGTATSAVAAYHFYRVPPLGLPANLLVMPVVSTIVMPAGVAALAALPFGLEALPLKLMGIGIDWMIAVAAWAERTGPAGLVGRVSAPGVLVSVFGLLWLSIWTRPWRILGAPVALLGLALMPLAPSPDLLVADDGRTIASRGADGRLVILRDGGGSFAADTWLRLDADPRPASEASLADPVRCDPLGCTLPLGRAPAAGGNAAGRPPIIDTPEPGPRAIGARTRGPLIGMPTLAAASVRGPSRRPARPADATAAPVALAPPGAGAPGTPHPPTRTTGTARAPTDLQATVAVANSIAALAEDCRNAVVVITRHTARRCAGPALVVDRRTLRQSGSISVTFAADRPFRVRRLRRSRNASPRPWQPPPTVER